MATRRHTACGACGKVFVSARNLAQHTTRAKAGSLARCSGISPSSWNVRGPVGRFADAAGDNYVTPKWAWAELFAAMPGLRSKKLWDPFFCAGETTVSWKSLGVRRFYHGKVDFFKSVRKVSYDIIVTNPPYSTKQLIVATLVSVGKPFVLLMRTSVLFSLWFRRMVPNFKLVLPSRQVDFTGLNGQKLSFDAVFICVGCTAGRSLMVCPRE